jgi:hypothetical protein
MQAEGRKGDAKEKGTRRLQMIKEKNKNKEEGAVEEERKRK